MNIGEIIKNLREEKELGLNELSRLSGVPSSYISSLEQGKKGNPSLSIIVKIAKALSMTEAEISKVLLSLDKQDYTWNKLQQELYELNTYNFDEDKGTELQKLCIEPITRHLLRNAGYLDKEDFVFIANNIQNLVNYIVTRNTK